MVRSFFCVKNFKKVLANNTVSCYNKTIERR
nr:MAG TPA: hypothetical protein [Caudoviricetes sp.]